MEKSSSRNVLLSIIGVLILIVAVVGISYAIFNNTILGTKDNSIKTGHVAFSYTENSDNGIFLEDAIPMDDSTGKTLHGDKNEFNFTITSSEANKSSLNYEIYAAQSASNTLDDKYVKVYLTDGNDNPVDGYTGIVPTYNSLTNSSDNSSKLLYSSTISPNKSKSFRLKIWVSSDYNLTMLVKNFSFKVNVKGQM